MIKPTCSKKSSFPNDSVQIRVGSIEHARIKQAQIWRFKMPRILGEEKGGAGDKSALQKPQKKRKSSHPESSHFQVQITLLHSEKLVVFEKMPSSIIATGENSGIRKGAHNPSTELSGKEAMSLRNEDRALNLTFLLSTSPSKILQNPLLKHSFCNQMRCDILHHLFLPRQNCTSSKRVGNPFLFYKSCLNIASFPSPIIIRLR